MRLCKLSSGRNVYLIDTSGFDDIDRSDTEVLREIAASFARFHNRKYSINGIIYLHRISDVRMPESATRNLAMFSKLCGSEALKKVILATIMWNKVDEAQGSQREMQLRNRYWVYMLGQQSSMERHYDTQDSAQRLMQQILQKSPVETAVSLVIQVEMVDEKRDLVETQAGQEVDGGLGERVKRAKEEAEEMKKQMQTALVKHDEPSVRMLEVDRRNAEERMQRLLREQEELKVNVEHLWQERYDRLQQEVEKTERRNREILEQLQTARLAQEQQSENFMKQTTQMKELEDQLVQLMRNSKVRSHSGENTMHYFPVTATLYGDYCWFVALIRDHG